MKNKNSELFKKLIALVMVVFMAMSVIPYTGFAGMSASAASDEELIEDHYIYTVENKKAIILGTDGKLKGKLTIPSKLGGYPVTEIGAMAFSFCDYLTEIIIPDNVVTIGEDAFSYCTFLKSVTIGKGLKKLEGNPFMDCTVLKSFNISKDNPYFCSDENGVIFNKEMTELMIYPSALSVAEYKVPEGVKVIKRSSFAYNTKISSVILPSTLTEIEDEAFYFCTSLKNVTSFDGLYKIGMDAFADTSWYTAEPDSLVYLGNVFIGYNGEGTSPREIVLKEGTVGIASGALSYIMDTQSIVIPASTVYIGEGAVISAGLERITVDKENKYFCSDSAGVLYTKDMKKLIAYPSAAVSELYKVADNTEIIGSGSFGAAMYLLEVELPDTVTKLEDSAFAGALSLNKIKMSKNITEIGENAFSFCTALSSITIPDKVKKIPSFAFMFCMSLRSIKLGKNVSEIGDMAFSSSSIKTINLTDSVRTVGVDAFSGCEYLTKVTIGKNLKTIDGNAFTGCFSLKKFVVDSKNKYFSADGTGTLLNKKQTKLIAYPCGRTSATYSVPKTVTNIGERAFKDAERLKTISLAEKTKIIGASAFSGCARLKSVNLLGVTTVGKNAFEYCENLESVYFSKKIKTISEDAFYDCSDLSDVYYAGTKKEWKKVEIIVGEDIFGFAEPLDGAEMHYSHKHSYDKGKVALKANYIRNGYKLYTCKECECVKTTDIAKTKLKKADIKKAASSKKKQITVTWNPVKDASGYLVKCSTSKKFTDKTTKTYTLKKQKTAKTTLKKLKSGKKYFVKLRAYKTASGVTVYGAYSKVMTVKVK